MVGTGQPKDVHEVINYVKAMNYGLERLNDLPLCTRLVKEIHEQLLHGVRGGLLRPGELRRSQSWIGPTGCSLRDAHFVPPPPHEIGNLLSDLEKFVHSPGDLPALVWIGIVHAQFETIHPFLDGNGRVGRLLITFLLCQQEILLKPVLYLSYFFKKFRQEYYERLQMVRDAGDWEGWLAFFLQGVIEVSTEATQTARRIVSLREEHRSAVTTHFGHSAANGLRVLEGLYQQPHISVAGAQRLTRTSYSAANNLVSRFVKLGILEEATGNKRNRIFMYEPYIHLFREDKG